MEKYRLGISVPKFLLFIMRITFFLFVIGVLQTYAIDTYAQKTHLTIHENNIKLGTLFDEIESQTDFYFFYNNDIIDKNLEVSINVNNKTIFEVLDAALRGTDITYQVNNKAIILNLVDNKNFLPNQNQKQVTGTVTDEQGEPIIGANIVEKGTTNGTVTDYDGKFLISGVANDAVLVVSYIGYLHQEISIDGRNSVTVRLVEDTQALEELVVVGYGVQKKVNLTGSVSTISSESISDRAISNISQGLQGLAPGMTVTNPGGQPGRDQANILIRGQGTFNVSTPLVLIDGIEGDMNILDPQDIENISILKDASSAAIYGSKAANGVILISTKRGRVGSPRITYNGLFGWASPTDLIERTSSAELAQLTNEAEYWGAISEGATPEQAERRKPYSAKDIELYADGSKPFEYPNTDWYNLFYVGSGFTNQHNLNMEGGSDWVSYRTSFGYKRQEGIVKNASNKQYNIRTNLDLKLSEKIGSRINLNLINTLMKEPTNPISWESSGSSEQTFRQVNRISPMVPYKYEDGTYGTISDGNPIAFQDLGSTGNTENDHTTAQIEVYYNIIDGLTLNASTSYFLNNKEFTLYRKDIQYNPSKYDGPIRLTKNHIKDTRKQGDVLLTYTNTFNQAHTLNSLLGVHSELYEYRVTSAYRQEFPSSDVTDLDGGSLVGIKNSGHTRELAMNSMFGRVQYNYLDKYLLEGNLRGDASSRFAKKHRMGWFPSFSGAWRISNEAFMENTRSFLTDLKLRGSWGTLGNQDIRGDYYPYINTYSLSAKYPFDDQIVSGATQTENKIEDISWEQTRIWGAGIDMVLFDRLSLTLDYYNKKTTGILMQVNVPTTYGYSGYWDNIGAMRNQGIELQFNYNTKINNVSLNLNGNFAYNMNKVLSLGNIEAQKGARNIVMVGKEYQAFYGYKSDGIFQSQQEIDKAPKYTMIDNERLIPGDIKLVDKNGDGVIDEDDKVILSSRDPRFTFAFNIGATWKNFDMNLFFQGVADVTRYYTDELYGEFNGDSGHPSKLWLQRWTPDNLTNKWPRASNFRTYNLPEVTASDFWLVKADYLRLKDLQLGYSLPKSLLNSVSIDALRVYYSGSNLFTFKKGPRGIDPEAPAGWGAYYVQTKTHSVGVSVTF